MSENLKKPPNFQNLSNFDEHIKFFEREICRRLIALPTFLLLMLFINADFNFSFRYTVFTDLLERIKKDEHGIDKFSKGYEDFGIKVAPDNGIICREWAPLADSLSLCGDFSKPTVYTFFRQQ